MTAFRSRPSAGPEIDRLVQLFAKLPGLGPRSAKKAVLALLRKRTGLLDELAAALTTAAGKIRECETCGNIDTQSPCSICNDASRDASLIVVVADVGDLWALERSGIVRARYHVLGGHLSPIEGIGPDKLFIGALLARAKSAEVREVLLALNATVEGQSTAHYLSDQLQETGVAVSRLAQGVPIGGELDYLDDGTIAAAFKARRKL